MYASVTVGGFNFKNVNFTNNVDGIASPYISVNMQCAHVNFMGLNYERMYVYCVMRSV